MNPSDTVTIHGEPWNRAELAPKVEECRKRQWRKQRWMPRDALVQREGGMTVPYWGQAYNPAEFELVRGGWKRNLCEICFWELCESTDLQHFMGYTEGRRWLCIECHDLFIQTR